MPILSMFLRRAFQVAAAFLIFGILISCATKKNAGTPPGPAATAKASGKKKTAASNPTPSPTATPAPTPQMSYVATVKVDGVEVGQNQGSDTNAIATPSPSPSPTPSPKASPSPTPKKKSSPLNFISGPWRKIFPPKPTPAPTPGETGKVTFRVTTADGGQTEQVAHEAGSDGMSPPPMPAPTPIQIKMRPTEGFLMRMWHKIFPKKKEPPSALPPQWTGTIKLVNEHEGYALIDSPASFSIPVGETLNSVGNDAESGVLRVTADRNPPFFIADIVSGKPQAGDRVYSPKP